MNFIWKLISCGDQGLLDSDAENAMELGSEGLHDVNFQVIKSISLQILIQKIIN